MLVVTTNDLPGYRIVKHFGVVRGITVRSRSVIGNLGGAIQSVFGGKLSVYTNLAETARQEAYDLLVQHAQELGANAIIAMRFDTSAIGQNWTEICAYGRPSSSPDSRLAGLPEKYLRRVQTCT